MEPAAWEYDYQSPNGMGREVTLSPPWLFDPDGVRNGRALFRALALTDEERAAAASYTRRADETSVTVSVSSIAGAETNMLVFRRASTVSALHTSGRLAFYSVGESLDLEALDTRVSALITAIGAAI